MFLLLLPRPAPALSRTRPSSALRLRICARSAAASAAAAQATADSLNEDGVVRINEGYAAVPQGCSDGLVLKWSDVQQIFYCDSADASSITDDSLGFEQLKSVLALDSSVLMDLGDNHFNYDLDGTGDINIKIDGVTAHYFRDNGDVKLGNSTELFVDTSANRVGV